VIIGDQREGRTENRGKERTVEVREWKRRKREVMKERNDHFIIIIIIVVVKLTKRK